MKRQFDRPLTIVLLRNPIEKILSRIYYESAKDNIVLSEEGILQVIDTNHARERERKELTEEANKTVSHPVSFLSQERDGSINLCLLPVVVITVSDPLYFVRCCHRA